VPGRVSVPAILVLVLVTVRQNGWFTCPVTPPPPPPQASDADSESRGCCHRRYKLYLELPCMSTHLSSLESQTPTRLVAVTVAGILANSFLLAFSGTVISCLQSMCFHATSSRGSGVPMMPRSAFGLHVNSTGHAVSAYSVLWHVCSIPTGARPQCATRWRPIPHVVYSLLPPDIVQRC